MSTENIKAAVDGFACLDDFSHAELCADRLLSGKTYDATETRALWQSALISLRRAMANSQTMYTGQGGAVAKPFNRKDAKQHLPERLHGAFDELLTLSDKCVAHRQPIQGVRTVEIDEEKSSGNAQLRGRHMLPTIEQRKALKEVAEKLGKAALDASAAALAKANSQNTNVSS